MPIKVLRIVSVSLILALTLDPHLAGAFSGAASLHVPAIRPFETQALDVRSLFTPANARFPARWPVLRLGGAILATALTVSLFASPAHAQSSISSESASPPAAVDVLKKAAEAFDANIALADKAQKDKGNVHHYFDLGMRFMDQRGPDVTPSFLRGIGPVVNYTLPLSHLSQKLQGRLDAVTAEKDGVNAQTLRQEQLMKLADALLQYQQAEQEQSDLETQLLPAAQHLRALEPAQDDTARAMAVDMETVKVRRTAALGQVRQLSPAAEVSLNESLDSETIVQMIQTADSAPLPDLKQGATVIRQAIAQAHDAAEGHMRSGFSKSLPTALVFTVGPYLPLKGAGGLSWWLNAVSPQFTRYKFDWNADKASLNQQIANLEQTRQQTEDSLLAALLDLAAYKQEYDAARNAVQAETEAIASAAAPDEQADSLQSLSTALAYQRELGTQLIQQRVQLRLAGFSSEELEHLAALDPETKKAQQQAGQLAKSHVDAAVRAVVPPLLKDGEEFIKLLNSHAGTTQKVAEVRTALKVLKNLGTPDEPAETAAAASSPSPGGTADSWVAPKGLQTTVSPPAFAYATRDTGVSPDEITIKNRAATWNAPPTTVTLTANAASLKSAHGKVKEIADKLDSAHAQVVNNNNLLVAVKVGIQKQALSDRIARLKETQVKLQAQKVNPLSAAKIKLWEMETRRLQRELQDLKGADVASPTDLKAYQAETSKNEVVYAYELAVGTAELNSHDLWKFIVAMTLQRGQDSFLAVFEPNTFINPILHAVQNAVTHNSQKTVQALQDGALLQAESVMSDAETRLANAEAAYIPAQSLEKSTYNRLNLLQEIAKTASSPSAWKAKADEADAYGEWRSDKAALDQAAADLQTARAVHDVFDQFLGLKKEALPGTDQPVWSRLDKSKRDPAFAASFSARQAAQASALAKLSGGNAPGLFALDATPFAALTPAGPPVIGTKPWVYGGRFAWTVDFSKLKAAQQEVAAGLGTAVPAATQAELAKGLQAATYPVIGSLLGEEAELRRVKDRLTELINHSAPSAESDRLRSVHLLAEIEAKASRLHAEAVDLANSQSLDLARIAPLDLRQPAKVFELPGPAEESVPKLLDLSAPTSPVHFWPVLTFTGFRNGVRKHTGQGIGFTLGNYPVTKYGLPAQRSQDAADKSQRERVNHELIEGIGGLSEQVNAGVWAYNAALTRLKTNEASLRWAEQVAPSGPIDIGGLNQALENYVQALEGYTTIAAQTRKTSNELRIALGRDPGLILQETSPAEPALYTVTLSALPKLTLFSPASHPPAASETHGAVALPPAKKETLSPRPISLPQLGLPSALLHRSA